MVYYTQTGSPRHAYGVPRDDTNQTTLLSLLSNQVTKCNQLKLLASDGKNRLTDVADPETLLRLIQSVPSPKAELIFTALA